MFQAKLLRSMDESNPNPTAFNELRSATGLALSATKMTAQVIGSHTDLFGPAVEGLAERFTATQQSSQTIRHFLRKRSSSLAASIRPKMTPTQQPAKAAPPAVQPAAKPEPHLSCSARLHPAKRQGPRPKIVLDPAPQASS